MKYSKKEMMLVLKIIGKEDCTPEECKEFEGIIGSSTESLVLDLLKRFTGPEGLDPIPEVESTIMEMMRCQVYLQARCNLADARKEVLTAPPHGNRVTSGTVYCGVASEILHYGVQTAIGSMASGLIDPEHAKGMKKKFDALRALLTGPKRFTWTMEDIEKATRD